MNGSFPAETPFFGRRRKNVGGISCRGERGVLYHARTLGGRKKGGGKDRMCISRLSKDGKTIKEKKASDTRAVRLENERGKGGGK